VGTTRSGVMGLAAAIMTRTAVFSMDFPAAGLVAVADLGTNFLGPAVFLVAGNIGCLGASVAD